MGSILGWLSWLITARPYLTLLVLILITVVLGAGATRRAPPPQTAATLPEDSAVAEVLVQVDELFGDSGEASVVTLLFRGEALTPDGLSQMDSLLNDMVRDPKVGDLLAPANPVVAPSLLVKTMLQVEDLRSVTQADIESIRSFPDVQKAFDAMTGTDTDGTPVAIATIRLRDIGDERIEIAERIVRDLADGDEGPPGVSSISSVVIEDEYKKATEEGMAPLIGLAF